MQAVPRYGQALLLGLALAAGPIAALHAAPEATTPAVAVASFVPEGYVIGPGDVVQVIVFGEKDLSGAYRVEAAGTISFPYISKPLRLAGCTVVEAQELLTQHLSAILKRPRVTLTLDEAKSVRIVSVMGAVRAAGVVELPLGATVFSAIARAGGFAADAGTDAVLLLHPTGEGQRVDLSEGPGERLTGGSEASGAGVLVRSGDIVWIPRSTHRITVLGPVARPGRFAVTKGESLTLLDAVSTMAGGPAEGTRLGSALLVRQEGNSEPIDLRKLLLEGDLSQNLALAPGDIVIVAEAERIAIVGAVNNPTSFIPQAACTLVDALSRASGLTARADLRHASIMRDGHHIPIDLAAVWLRGQIDSDVSVHPGDVVLVPEVDNQVIVTGEVDKPGAYEVQPNTRVLTMLAAAGGPTPMADLRHTTIMRDGKSIRVNLQQTLDPGGLDPDSAAAQNSPVFPGDVVFVPRGGVAYVLGAVAKPGAYPVQEDTTIVDAIAEAGGIAAHGTPKHILLARRDERGEPVIVQLNMNVVVAKGGSEPMLKLRPGDIIYVARQKRSRDYRALRDIFFGASGLLLTLFR